MPSLAPDVLAQTGPWLNLAEKIGSIQSQLSTSGVVSVDVLYEGDFAQNQLVHVTRALMKGLLAPIMSGVNYVNAPTLAAQRGIRLTESRADAGRHGDQITVRAVAVSGKSCTIAATLFHGDPTHRFDRRLRGRF